MISLSYKQAREAVQMFDICYSEGLGSDSTELVYLAGEQYPELKKEFSYLPWDFIAKHVDGFEEDIA